MAGGGDQAGDGPDHEAVVDQEKHAAQAEQHAGREAPERDADVVKDVEPGHAVFSPLVRPLSNPSAYAFSICSTLSAGRIWSANARERIAPDEAEHARQHEQRERQREEAAVAAQRAREISGDQLPHGAHPVGRRAVQRVVRARGEAVEQAR